jgi:hypothetical protein
MTWWSSGVCAGFRFCHYLYGFLGFAGFQVFRNAFCLDISKSNTNRRDHAAVLSKASHRPLSSEISIRRVQRREGSFSGVYVTRSSDEKIETYCQNSNLGENASNPGCWICVLCALWRWSSGFCSRILNFHNFDSFLRFEYFSGSKYVLFEYYEIKYWSGRLSGCIFGCARSPSFIRYVDKLRATPGRLI